MNFLNNRVSNRTSSALLIFALILSLFTPSQALGADPAQPGGIAGRVVDSVTGEGLPGYTVFAYVTTNKKTQTSATTTSNGEFSLNPMVRGVWTVTVSKNLIRDGSQQLYILKSTQVSISDQVQPLEIALEPYPRGARTFTAGIWPTGLASGDQLTSDLQCNTITGQIANYSQSSLVISPLAQVFHSFVSLADFTNCWLYVSAYRPSTYSAAPVLRYQSQINVTQTQSQEVFMKPKGTATVSGRILSSTNSDYPVANARVFLSLNSANYSWSGSAIADALGNYSIPNVPSGSIRVNLYPTSADVDSRNFYSAEHSIEVTDSSTVRNFSMNPFPTGSEFIVGTVRDYAGNPIEGATVTISLNSALRYASYVRTTNASGSFSKDTLPAGQYSVSVSHPSYLASNSKAFRLDGGNVPNIPFKLRLRGTAVLTGEVRNSVTGEVLTNARVQVSFHDQETGSSWGSSAQSTSGTYTVNNVPDAEVSVSVTMISVVGQPSSTKYLAYSQRKILISPGSNTFHVLVDPYPTGTGSITGRVKSYSTGLGIAGATISLNCWFRSGQYLAYSATSDSEGGYVFGQLTPGLRCTIGHNKANHVAVRSQYEIEGDSNFATNQGVRNMADLFLVEASSNSVSGFVTNLGTEPAIMTGLYVDASYYVEGLSLGWSRSSTVAANGSYTISGLPVSIPGAKIRLGVYSEQTRIYNREEVSVPYSGQSFSQDLGFYALEQGDAVVSGVVRDKVTSQPLSGINITLSGSVDHPVKGTAGFWRSTTSDALGRYSFSGVNRSSWVNMNVNNNDEDASYPGPYKYTHTSFALKETEEFVTKDFKLVPRPTGTNSIQGTLRDPQGNVMPNTYVSVQGSGAANDFHVGITTNFDGTFKFENLPKGSFTLYANVYSNLYGRQEYKQTAYSQRTVRFETSSDAPITNFQLSILRYAFGITTLKGQLWDETLDAPIANVAVGLEGNPSNFPGTFTKTDDQGNWQIEGLAEGQYTVTYEADNSQEERRRLPNPQDITINGTAEHDLGRVFANKVGSGNYSLEITVVDGDTYLPITEAGLSATLTGSNWWLNQVTDSNGKMNLTNLESGNYYLNVNLDGYWGAERDVSVDGDHGTKKIKFVLDRKNLNGKLEGNVRDRWGQPVPGATVCATHDVYFRYWGGDDGPCVDSDENGHYSATGIAVGKPINFRIYAAEGQNYSPYFEKIAFTEDDFSNLNKNVTLEEGASLSGSIADSSGSNLQNITLYAIDHLTDEYISSTNPDEGGVYTFSNLPAKEIDIFLADSQAWGEDGFGRSDVAAWGYIKRTGSRTSVTAGQRSTETAISLVSGTNLEIGETRVAVGGKIHGTVKVRNGEHASTRYNRDISVSLFRLTTSGWKDMSYLVSTSASRWTDGKFWLNGVPDGQYKIKFSEPWALGQAVTPLFFGPSPTLDSATIITIANGSTVSNVDVTLSVPAPLAAPAAAETSNLNEKLEDQVKVESGASVGSGVTLDLGEDFAGEWVAVTIETTPTSVSTQSLRKAALRLASTPILSTSNWRQVGADGKLTISVSSAGEGKIVVQDANNTIIGWTSISISSAGSQPIASGGSSAGGGGGGGGGGTDIPTIPTVVVAPQLTGKFAVGEIIKVDKGQWKADWPLSYSYKWFRCDTQQKAKTKLSSASGCAEIPAEVGLWYVLTDVDLKKHIAVEITASDETNLGVFETQSISATPFNTITLTKKPKISGTAKVGKTLTASKPAWGTSLKPKTVRYQWYRCSTTVSAASLVPAICSPLSKATKLSYAISPKDKGKYLTLLVSASIGDNTLSFTLGTKSKVK